MKMFSLTSSNAASSLAWKSNTSLYISHSLWLLEKENNLNIKLNDLHDKVWIHRALYSMVKCFHTPRSTPQHLLQIHYSNQHFYFYYITKWWSRCTIMTSILFDTEYGGRMFLQNTGIFLEDYRVAYMTRHYSSLVPTLNLEWWRYWSNTERAICNMHTVQSATRQAMYI
jgi:hypothetical protein